MANISFDNGVKTYNFNGGEKEVAICITDFNIDKRLKESEEKFNEMIEKYGQDTETVIEDLDRETRKIIDYIYNAPVSECAFGNTNCWTTTQNGSVLFLNLLQGMMKEFSQSTSKSFEKFSKELNKRLKK